MARRLRSVASRKARLGSESARGRLLPSRRRGLTSVTSTATWIPPKAGRPFATPPAGARQKRAPRCSSRNPCRSALERASAPDQDPRGGASSAVVTEPSPPQRHSRDDSGSGSRNRRSRTQLATSSGMANSSRVGKAVRTTRLPAYMAGPEHHVDQPSRAAAAPRCAGGARLPPA